MTVSNEIRDLHLAATLEGLPAAFALTGVKAGERQALLVILTDPAQTAGRAGRISTGTGTTAGMTSKPTGHDHRRE